MHPLVLVGAALAGVAYMFKPARAATTVGGALLGAPNVAANGPQPAGRPAKKPTDYQLQVARKVGIKNPETKVNPRTGAIEEPGKAVLSEQVVTGDVRRAEAAYVLANDGVAAFDAAALQAYLAKNGPKASAEFKALVTRFQQNHNADAQAVRLLGTLVVDGVYGGRTSAVLTAYTGSPVPNAVALRAAKTNSTVAKVGGVKTPEASTGATAHSGSDLLVYLKAHGHDRTTACRALVKQFQHDVNTDPKFPGPAFPDASRRILRAKLAEDGVYGPKTSDALAIVTLERIPAA